MVFHFLEPGLGIDEIFLGVLEREIVLIFHSGKEVEELFLFGIG
jgi:hypothetical protein